MSEKSLVSVIVPVYNVAAYLQKCVESIVSQTYANLEIILVDDGSTDGSSALCDALASTDPRVRVIHKQNGGLSDARNAGLRACSGELVSFIDSDDYISPAFIEVLCLPMRTAGVRMACVPGGHAFNDGDDVVLRNGFTEAEALKATRIVPPHEHQQLLLYQAIDTGTQWRICERGLLGEDPFPTGLLYEDLATTYRLVHAAGDVALVDCRDLYAYRQRPTSIIRQSYRHVKAASALEVADQLYGDIAAWYPDLTPAAASRCFSVCRMVFAQIPVLGEGAREASDDRADLWKALTRYRRAILTDTGARKRERLAAMVAYTGMGSFTAFCKLARKVGLMR